MTDLIISPAEIDPIECDLVPDVLNKPACLSLTAQLSSNMSTSRHCYVINCSNGDAKLRKWQKSVCSLHGVFNGELGCNCEPPFE